VRLMLSFVNVFVPGRRTIGRVHDCRASDRDWSTGSQLLHILYHIPGSSKLNHVRRSDNT